MRSPLHCHPRPLGGYHVIYADPPWAFETWGGDDVAPTQGEQPYECMTRAQLRALPVRAMAGRDAVLFMWVTDSNLEEGLALGRCWGFKYQTIAFIWDKGERIGMGHWTRKQGEVCLLFTVGQPSRQARGVRQIIRAPRREHSRKPEAAYERIERLVRGPYLELFARTRRRFWSSWGDEVDKFEPEPLGLAPRAA